MSERHALSHAEANDLAGLFVLDALEPAEMAAVREHLASCMEDHSVFAELAAVVPALAASVEPIDAPAPLRERVLAAIAAEAAGAPAATVAPAPERAIRQRTAAAARAPRWQGIRDWQASLGWAAAAAAVLVLVVVGAWAFNVQSRNEALAQRQALIADALTARDTAGAQVAQLSGSGSAAGATGFAAVTPEGESYIVMLGLPRAPAGEIYQAWYIADGAPVSAGLVEVGDDGIGVLSGGVPPPGTQVVALTLERAGGVDQPTDDPVVAGELSA